MVYKGIGPERGKVVHKDDAFDVALEEVASNREIRQEFIDWFFSGNWVKTEEDE